MSKSLISVGTTANDGTGDTLLAGAQKVNSNFNEVYSVLGDGSNINIGLAATISQFKVSGISTFTEGPILIGSASSTGTSSQRLQVTDGAYIGGNLGIGSTNPSSQLYVVGNSFITGVSTFSGITTFTSSVGFSTNVNILGVTTVGLGTTSSPPNNSQMSFELTSNTNLRVKVRGTDGTLRMVDLTLSWLLINKT